MDFPIASAMNSDADAVVLAMMTERQLKDYSVLPPLIPYTPPGRGKSVMLVGSMLVNIPNMNLHRGLDLVRLDRERDKPEWQRRRDRSREAKAALVARMRGDR